MLHRYIFGKRATEKIGFHNRCPLASMLRNGRVIAFAGPDTGTDINGPISVMLFCGAVDLEQSTYEVVVSLG